jgi:hypothetical protein
LAGKADLERIDYAAWGCDEVEPPEQVAEQVAGTYPVLILSAAFLNGLLPLVVALGAVVPFAGLRSVHQQLKVKVEGSLSAAGGDNLNAGGSPYRPR